ncbi:MAG TPA: porin [Steroidobacteraceae bacterium]|jgi:phosphate-selective porin OprO/OprP
MSTLVKTGVMAALAGVGLAAVLHADDARADGAFQLKSADGNFSGSLTGRLEFDGYYDNNDNRSKIGSGVAGSDSSDSFRFRRAWLTLAGNVYSFDYHVDYDFVANTLQRAWISHEVLPHGTLYIGQDKPWASLDEIASDTETPFLERNIASSSGINSVATYTNGLYYAWNNRLFTEEDNVWIGLSGSSLHKQSGGADSSTQGTAFNARVAYAPIVEKNRWLHFGVSFINANAAAGSTTAGTNALLVSYVYGNHFDSDEKLTLANYPVSSTGTRPHSNTLGGELAAAYGPGYLQAEYDDAKFHEAGEPDNTVKAYSVTGAVMLTGETRPYKPGDASYGGITPGHAYGAWELAVRYEKARNDGNDGVFKGLALPGVKASLATLDQVTLISAGVNYYPNAHVRFMLDYEHGKADLGKAGTDSPNTVEARAQLTF